MKVPRPNYNKVLKSPDRAGKSDGIKNDVNIQKEVGVYFRDYVLNGGFGSFKVDEPGEVRVRVRGSTLSPSEAINEQINLHRDSIKEVLGLVYTNSTLYAMIVDLISSLIANLAYTSGAVPTSRYEEIAKAKLKYMKSELYVNRYDQEEANSQLEIPNERYSGVADGNPSDFLKRIWREHLKRGVLFQHIIRNVDPKLMRALDREFPKGRRDDLNTLLPPKEKEGDLLLEQAGVPIDSPFRPHVLAALRKAGATVKPR